MTSLRTQMRYLNPYEIYKLLVNEYLLKKPGDTKFLDRDRSKDRTDFHVLKDNHRFIWDDDKQPETWEEQFAKKYYEKLFKEYCICDLSRYKENKVALRWRTEKEVISSKGQFICGNKLCNQTEDLRSWEINFAYQEQGEKKNALVKIRLCPSCSKKLNFHSKKREVKCLEKKVKHKNKDVKLMDSTKDNAETKEDSSNSANNMPTSSKEVNEPNISSEESPWEEHKPTEVKSREEEMEEYLHDLLI